MNFPTWFDSPAKVAALRAVALEWEGTPFFANSEACGPRGGVDCVRLIHAIYSALGVIPRVEIGRTRMDRGLHRDDSLLIVAFETWPQLKARFVCLPANALGELLPGDMLCFASGRVSDHGGLMLDRSEFIHALKPEGVYRLQLGAAMRGWRILGQLKAVYRPQPDAA